MGQSNDRVVAVIPARWASSRFPGKPLAELAGEPMIAHVVRRASEASTVEHVVVATDDERIARAAESAGAEAVLTGDHPSGTDRVAAAVADRHEWSLVVNLQGDEPLLAGANVDALVAGLQRDAGCAMATLCRPLEPERADDPNAVKVVRDRDNRALYFSRSAIPYPRRPEQAAPLWRLHLGIYGFRREALARFVALPPSALEMAEGLEQLRALENGISILVLDAPEPAFGVDTPEDLDRVQEILKQRTDARQRRGG
jgi:3-deoxy-manno-octulosonate cytidylyltransferase (CMP-KDO synthetase)